MSRFVVQFVVLVSLVVFGSCNESSVSTPSCPEGSETCPCYDNGSCDAGLECQSDLCVAPTSAQDGDVADDDDDVTPTDGDTTDDDDDITTDGDTTDDDDDSTDGDIPDGDADDDDDDDSTDGDAPTDGDAADDDDDDSTDGDSPTDGDAADDDDDDTTDGDSEDADGDGEDPVVCAGNQCTIDNHCWNHNQTNPAATCTYCDVAVDRTGWTPKLAGLDCDNGRECVTGEKCAEGGICTGGTELDCPYIGESCPTVDERRCVYHTVLLCGQEGTWELVQVCGDSGLFCEDGECVARQDDSCTFGEDPRRCVGDISYYCRQDGTWTDGGGRCSDEGLRCWLGWCWHPEDYPLDD